MSGSEPRIAIIGAGFGGVGIGAKLKKAGFHNFTIFEKSDGIGGTWWDNRYPGAAVDTPSILYSYSFNPVQWSRTHVEQAELQAYIQGTAEKFGIVPHIRLNTAIDRVEWDARLSAYHLFSGDEEITTAEHVVTAVGLLNDPKHPSWPGLDSFTGTAMHSARWDKSIDLTGKTIAVIGTGSTAAQVIPTLAKTAKHITVFQREPGWVMPKNDREYTAEEREAMTSPLAQRIVRLVMLWKREKGQFRGAAYTPGNPINTGAEMAARDYINRVFADRPDLIEKVTPKYPYYGKRTIISDEYYPSLALPNVTLIPHAVDRVTPTGVVDTEGTEYPVDALALSTGFKVEFLSTLKVVGPPGEIHDLWKGDPTTFFGLMVAGYPNFFMLYGPNTNGGAIASMLEIQADYIVAAIKHAHRKGARRIEINRMAQQIFDAWVQEALRPTAFKSAGNYFSSASGKITTQWHDGVFLYAALTRVLRAPLWKLSGRVENIHEPDLTTNGSRGVA